MRSEGATAVLPEAGPETFTLEAMDVTGTQRVTAEDIQPSLPAESVARALAARMALPQNVPWALRSDTTGAFLEDRTPIGEQIEPGAQVTVVPKTHLG
jgi:hypothetical protein